MHFIMLNQPTEHLPLKSDTSSSGKMFLLITLEQILRGTTDSLPKYSKFHDHHQFGQNDAV